MSTPQLVICDDRSDRSLISVRVSIHSGPSPQVIRALVEAAPLVQHYPDPDCFSLKQVIARRWKISPDRLVIGNGSSELIDVIPRALCIRSALIVGPTYGEYARAVDRAGGRSRMVLASRKEEYRPPLQRVTHRVEVSTERPNGDRRRLHLSSQQSDRPAWRSSTAE